jgi:hypothetical protein
MTLVRQSEAQCGGEAFAGVARRITNPRRANGAHVSALRKAIARGVVIATVALGAAAVAVPASASTASVANQSAARAAALQKVGKAGLAGTAAVSAPLVLEAQLFSSKVGLDWNYCSGNGVVYMYLESEASTCGSGWPSEVWSFSSSSVGSSPEKLEVCQSDFHSGTTMMKYTDTSGTVRSISDSATGGCALATAQVVNWKSIWGGDNSMTIFPPVPPTSTPHLVAQLQSPHYPSVFWDYCRTSGAEYMYLESAASTCGSGWPGQVWSFSSSSFTSPENLEVCQSDFHSGTTTMYYHDNPSDTTYKISDSATGGCALATAQVGYWSSEWGVDDSMDIFD